MYSFYQNRYANKLCLNVIRVKYSKEHTIFERHFIIKLSDDYIKAYYFNNIYLYFLGTFL